MVENKNFISILVLMTALAHAVLKKAPNKLSPEDSGKLMKHIQMTVRKTFPDTSEIVFGLFNLEMAAMIPFMKNMEAHVEDLALSYTEMVGKELNANKSA